MVRKMVRKWHPVTLAGALGIGKREMVAAYGGGGKTTLLGLLAREITAAGGRVVLTTTTKIYPPRGLPLIVSAAPREITRQLKGLLPHHPAVALGSALLPEGKLLGVEPDLLEKLYRQGGYSHYLVEADGARGRPLKGFAPYEPVIPAAAGLVIAVIGLDGLGARLDAETVHRPELFARQSGGKDKEFLDVAILKQYLEFMLARGGSLAPAARIVPVLNKLDRLQGDGAFFRAAALALRESADLKSVAPLIFTGAKETAAVKFILPPGGEPSVACVVLAAGKSERMGRDKLLLPLGPKTVLEHAVDHALQAEAVREVILVTRPRNRKKVAELFRGKNVRIVVNPRHREGMASSLQAGLAAVDPASQAVLFALGDQPFVPAAVFDLLTDSYQRHWDLVTLPLYRGKRGNPVLFDRRLWPRLMELKGDTGGRELLSCVPEAEISQVETGIPGIMQDIDTPEDYERLLRGALGKKMTKLK